MRLIDQLAVEGVQRVTFSGGEPTLHPEIVAIAQHAKHAGLATSIITNGARVTSDLLDVIDLVGVTIDSARDEVLASLGRGTGYLSRIIAVVRSANRAGARVKVNTVVCSMNADEDLSTLIRDLSPWKWKPLQFTYVPGENDASAKRLSVTTAQFDAFVERHAATLRGSDIWYAPEDATTVRSTYVMIDPSGRVFQHGPNGHRVSEPISDVGLSRALAQVGGYDRTAFLRRGGDVPVNRRTLPIVGEEGR